MKKQISLGMEAGRILALIHQPHPLSDGLTWSGKYNRKIDRKLADYQSCGIRLDQEAFFLEQIDRSRNFLLNRLTVFQHGDYHIGNMLLIPDGDLAILDFNRHSIGDPWEKFNRITWSTAVSPDFATG